MTINIRLKNKSLFDKKESEKECTADLVKKFNIRIHAADLEVITRLGKLDGISRTQLIDKFINEIIYEFLKSLDSFEEYGLLIKAADKLNGVDPWVSPTKSWFSDMNRDAMLAGIDHDLNNRITSERSDLYRHMEKLLKQSTIFNQNSVKQKGVSDE